MPQLTPEQQKALDEQKKQCPFCKIIAGEIPSKKVYEDDKVCAVLDINPAMKGHTLLMPKEHYPIMPLIPEETFIHLFKKVKVLSGALKEGTLTFGNTIFIANGYVAGQQSNHFMIHLIPREGVDGLDKLSLKPGSVDKEKDAEALKVLKQNLPLMLRQRYKIFPLPGKAEVQGQQVYTKEQIIRIVEQNPQLKEIILQQPHVLKSQLHTNPQLQKLFSAVNVDEVIRHFNPKYIPEQEAKVVAETKRGSEGVTNEHAASVSKQGSDVDGYDALIKLVQQNLKVKQLLLDDPALFKKKVQEIPQFREMFGSVDIDELRKRVQAVEQKTDDDLKSEKKQEPEPKSSLDSISDLIMKHY